MATGPRDVAQPHQGDPAQAAGLDQLLATGTHRVAVDAPRLDFGAATPFQGLVDAEHQRALAPVQVLEQQRQQDAGRRTGRPHRPVEHLVVMSVVPLVAASHDAERRGNLRWPGVRIAPTSSAWAFRQACPRPRPGVGLLNSVAKGTRTATMASGRVSMAGPFVRSGVRPSYPVFMLFLNYA